MNFKKLWESYWTQYEGYGNSKIGYIVSFKLKSGEEINTTIKKNKTAQTVKLKLFYNYT